MTKKHQVSTDFLFVFLGGDHKYSISPEEYVFAALNLYMVSELCQELE